jgi:hypothetical protein
MGLIRLAANMAAAGLGGPVCHGPGRGPLMSDSRGRFARLHAASCRRAIAEAEQVFLDARDASEHRNFIQTC